MSKWKLVQLTVDNDETRDGNGNIVLNGAGVVYRSPDGKTSLMVYESDLGKMVGYLYGDMAGRLTTDEEISQDDLRGMLGQAITCKALTGKTETFVWELNL